MPVPLPEITFLASPGPPTIVRWLLTTSTPMPPLAIRIAPVGSVPMKFPWMTLSFAVPAPTAIACWAFPETTLPAPATAPPIVLPVAPLVTWMPPTRFVFGRAAVPAALMPM